MDVTDIDDYTPPDTQDKTKLTLSGNYDEFKAFKKTQKYKKLWDDGLKVVFKPKKLNKKKAKKNGEEGGGETEETELAPNGNTDFRQILSDIVDREKNPYLLETFELIVNNREVSMDNVMYV